MAELEIVAAVVGCIIAVAGFSYLLGAAFASGFFSAKTRRTKRLVRELHQEFEEGSG